MIDIATNIAALTAKIQQVSAQSATWDREITLIAVSKKQPAEAITASSRCGSKSFWRKLCARGRSENGRTHAKVADLAFFRTYSI